MNLYREKTILRQLVAWDYVEICLYNGLFDIDMYRQGNRVSLTQKLNAVDAKKKATEILGQDASPIILEIDYMNAKWVRTYDRVMIE